MSPSHAADHGGLVGESVDVTVQAAGGSVVTSGAPVTYVSPPNPTNPTNPTSPSGGSSSQPESTRFLTPTADSVPVASSASVPDTSEPSAKPTTFTLQGPSTSFAPGSSELTAPMQARLASIAKEIGSRRAQVVVVAYGRPHSTGRPSRLVVARARAVADYLKKQGFRGKVILRSAEPERVGDSTRGITIKVRFLNE